MLNFIASWGRERTTVRELSRLSDRGLTDIGIDRADIRAVVESANRENATSHGTREWSDRMAPAWGTHARSSVTA